MQKVYVVTKAKLKGEEHYVTVKATKKETEKVVCAEYPYGRNQCTPASTDMPVRTVMELGALCVFAKRRSKPYHCRLEIYVL